MRITRHTFALANIIIYQIQLKKYYVKMQKEIKLNLKIVHRLKLELQVEKKIIETYSILTEFM